MKIVRIDMQVESWNESRRVKLAEMFGDFLEPLEQCRFSERKTVATIGKTKKGEKWGLVK